MFLLITIINIQRSLLNFEIRFLQHGIIKDDLSKYSIDIIKNMTFLLLHL